MPEQETFIDMPFPEKGVDLTHGFGNQPPGTTRVGVNVRLFDTFRMRARGGSRPGLKRLIDSQLVGPIQDLNTVVRIDPQAMGDETDPWNPPEGDDPPGDDDPSGDPGFGPMGGPPPGGPVAPDGGGVTRGPDGRDYPTGGWGWQPLAQEKVPVITWADPSSIYQGTPLSGTQLNAVATDPDTGDPVAGTFRYKPTSGDVLAVGTHTLFAVFTPDDYVSYFSTSDTALIEVVPAGGSATFLSDDSWTAPPGVTSVTAECWGGGQAGQQGFAGNGGVGGAGAYYARKTVAVVAGNVYTVTVGAGGVVTFGAGGDSWFVDALTVLAAGAFSATSSSGDVIFAGGASGLFSGSTGGGGGSSAGPASIGNDGAGTTGGAAVAGGGAGGNGGAAGIAGPAGANPGGGGGGGGSPNSAGGFGGDGQVALSW